MPIADRLLPFLLIGDAQLIQIISKNKRWCLQWRKA
nr:MAG TPA_asm: hypothetical protein [Caudoviricetes sp.]